MPDRPHHSDKWHSCVDKLTAKGHSMESAAAICTTSLQEAGEEIYAAEPTAMQADGASRCSECGSTVMVDAGRIVCMADRTHGIALGGPGSGWHAEQGHVPGSQGSQGGSVKATGAVPTKPHAPTLRAHLVKNYNAKPSSSDTSNKYSNKQSLRVTMRPKDAESLDKDLSADKEWTRDTTTASKPTADNPFTTSRYTHPSGAKVEIMHSHERGLHSQAVVTGYKQAKPLPS